MFSSVFSPAQLFGYLAFILGITAFSQKDDQRLRVLVVCLSLSYSAHFWLLGNFAAMSGSLLSAVRSWVSLRTRSYWAVAAILVANICIGVCVATRWQHALPILGSVLGTIAMFFLQGIALRAVLLIGTFLWLANNLFSGSIGGSALEVVIAITNTATIVRLYLSRNHALVHGTS